MDIHNKPYPLTAQSIEKAKQARDAERESVFELTGIRVTDTGTALPSRYPPKVHKVACGLCNYTASALNEGRAVNAVAGHIVSAHFPQHIKEGR